MMIVNTKIHSETRHTLSLQYLSAISILFLLLFPLVLKGQESDSTEKNLSLLFVGDIMGHDTQIAAAYDPGTGKYDYSSVFQFIKPILSEPDITIANLEVTLAGPPYKGYPQFSSPAAIAAACADAGIDYFVLANNHAADRGGQGILSTLQKLDSLGIPHTGSYRNAAERDSLSPLIIRRNGFNIALLNYTYGTNGLKVPKPVIVDSLNMNLISSDIRKAREKKPDAVILFVHWGTEYDTVPGTVQTQLAEFCLNSGADIIIGSHPHVIQKMIWSKEPGKKENIVAYSLGNFISNQRRPKTDGGSLVRIELIKKADSVYVRNAGYYLSWVYTPVENMKTRFYILPCSQFEKKPEFINETDRPLMTKFINDSRLLLNTQNKGIGEYIFDGEKWNLDIPRKNE
jgi:poly-gamma-glutamate synthesis protein (capsule biosynthesis protein)